MTARCYREANDYSPRQVGINGAALSASNSSNIIPIDGCSQVQLDLEVVNATAAALAVTCYPEVRRHGETDWRQMVTSSVAAGVITLSVRQIVFPTTAAAAATYAYSYPFTIEGVGNQEMRFRAVTAAGAGATDLAYLRVSTGSW